MPKDKDPVNKLRRKLKKIEKSLLNLDKENEKSRSTRTRSRSRSRSPLQPRRRRSSSNRRSPSRIEQDFLPGTSKTEDNITLELERNEKEDIPEEHAVVDLTENQGEEEISEEIIALFGEAPQEEKYGPELMPHLCSRWKNIIIKGLDKDTKTRLMEKYPPPVNCKIINAPKMNPEAQAAAGESVVKRDKAIEMKQMRVSCAIAALGIALGKLCKQPSGNEEIISYISDASRLLCDYQHCESSIRRHFVMTGLDNKSAREAVKDTEVDKWLFGENFSEKLKAAKAIEKTTKDLKGPNYKTKKPPGNLNYKGPMNTSRMKTQPQPRGGFQHYPKRQPYSAPGKHNNYQQKHRYHQAAAGSSNNRR